MPTLPWASFETPTADHDYLVMASHLPLRHRMQTPRFLRCVIQIRSQLKTADGLVGYSLLANPFRGHYWTLSAWRDQNALDRFFMAEPHHSVMRVLRNSMGSTTFTTWTVSGSALPVEWSQAKQRLTDAADSAD